MKYSDKLYLRYKQEIEQWDWNEIKKESINNCIYNCEDIQIICSTFLGSVFQLLPSGKYYTFWTTNQTIKDQIRDEAFLEALNEIAEINGMYITSGCGDPCDLFAETTITFDECHDKNLVVKFVCSDYYEDFKEAYDNYLLSL